MPGDTDRARQPSYLDFDIDIDIDSYAWKPDIDYRKYPEQYRVGKGEQGVLICQPYKDEIGPFWRFRDVEAATESSGMITSLFHDYLAKEDFVGADLARKYLQMGYTRARRYANYKGGKKYDKENGYSKLERGTGDPEKARAASVFYDAWKEVEADPGYAQRKKEWKRRYG